jgi:glycosyltransferase involved in cell wall biosynthesis
LTSRVSIDVVICTYNNAPLLDRALESLHGQRVSAGVDWRILIVDNNCEDDTRSVVEKHARVAQVPLTSVREPRQGLTPARVRGVKSTTGEWIAFVDDDCVLADDWIEEAASFAHAHPECGAFGGKVVLAWEVPPPDFATRYGWAFAEQDHGPEPKRVECLVGAGLVVRREALAACGWVDKQFLADRVGEKLVSGGDVELALRVGAAHELWYDPKLRLRHRIPERRMSPGYLKEVTYGLGSSKLFGDSMLWPGSYPRWLVISALGSREFAGSALRDAARAPLRRARAVDAAVSFSFLRGWLVGIWKLSRMEARERAALLGCATPPSDA